MSWARGGEPGTFGRRWLRTVGVPDRDLDRALAAARARAARYPWPVGALHPLLAGLFEWFVPLLALGRLRRASRLEPDALDDLLRRLRAHRWPVVRAVLMLVVAPLMEVATTEPTPPGAPHPLEGRLPIVRPLGRPTFDVLVIGSGAGGGPVAADLAEAGFEVGVVEAGDLVRPVPAGRIIEEHFVEQAMVGSLEGGTVVVIAGSTIGGSTSINSGTCLRPLPERLAEWDREWGTDFAGGGLDRWLDRAEETIGVSVPDRSLLSASSIVIERGLAALGRTGQYVLPRNAPGCTGSGRCCFGCPTGAKASTDRVHLPGAVADGARLLARTRATRIVETGDGVEVDVEGPGGRGRLRARHLVLSAGALQTPGLLRSSRLGARWRSAGSHLAIHPATKVFAHFTDLVDAERGVPQGLGYRPPELPRVTLEGIHTPRSVVGTMISAGGDRFRWWLDRTDHLASFGLMIRERALGRVLTVGRRPIVRYRLAAEDALQIGAGILLIGRAFLAAGAERLLLPVNGRPNEPVSMADLDRLGPEDFPAARLMLSGFHPQGTAGIGRVVDDELRLVGSDRISICDASVLPASPGVNPQITIMALSHRLADRLAEELR